MFAFVLFAVFGSVTAFPPRPCCLSRQYEVIIQTVGGTANSTNASAVNVIEVKQFVLKYYTSHVVCSSIIEMFFRKKGALLAGNYSQAKVFKKILFVNLLLFRFCVTTILIHNSDFSIFLL